MTDSSQQVLEAPRRNSVMRSATVSKCVVFAVGLLISDVCAATRGRVSGGTYTSPLGNFTVPVPQGIGTRTQDQFDGYSGIVSFHDDFGSLKSIFYLRLGEAALKIQNDPEKQRANLKRFLSDYAIPELFRPASPRANVLHGEHIKAGDHNAYFAIVDLPEGSTMFDAKAKKRHDTKRGVLIFVRGAFIYMLSTGENPGVFDLTQPAKPLNKLLESEKKRLVSLRSTITFK